MLRNIFFDVFLREKLGCFRCFDTFILDVSVVSKQEIVSRIRSLLVMSIMMLIVKYNNYSAIYNVLLFIYIRNLYVINDRKPFSERFVFTAVPAHQFSVQQVVCLLLHRYEDVHVIVMTADTCVRVA